MNPLGPATCSDNGRSPCGSSDSTWDGDYVHEGRVGATGLEPVTSSMYRRHSTTELRPCCYIYLRPASPSKEFFNKPLLFASYSLDLRPEKALDFCEVALLPLDRFYASVKLLASLGERIDFVLKPLFGHEAHPPIVE